ncbi:hypothetical protein V7068_11020 [Bacillus sp. JJ634]
MKYKDGWTATQRAEADAKVKALTEDQTIKTPSGNSFYVSGQVFTYYSIV